MPCLVLWQAFDELLLIKRGGRTIFFGETGSRSKNLINYFEVGIVLLLPTNTDLSVISWTAVDLQKAARQAVELCAQVKTSKTCTTPLCLRTCGIPFVTRCASAVHLATGDRGRAQDRGGLQPGDLDAGGGQQQRGEPHRPGLRRAVQQLRHAHVRSLILLVILSAQCQCRHCPSAGWQPTPRTFCSCAHVWHLVCPHWHWHCWVVYLRLHQNKPSSSNESRLQLEPSESRLMHMQAGGDHDPGAGAAGARQRAAALH